MGERVIALIGFMAAGKTRGARAIAAELGVEALDADAELERRLGEPIANFFEREGEAAFREQEERLTLELLGRGGVIALGGGAVESAAIRAALTDHVGVWCRIGPELAWERASRKGDRPLAADPVEFQRRFEHREPLYRDAAQAILPRGGDQTPALAARCLEALREHPRVRLVWARTATAEYPALIGPRALRLIEAAAGPKRWHCVADPGALSAQRDLLPPLESLTEAGGSEEAKTLGELERVLRALAVAGARRDDGLLAFGGGVVGDLGGFCAAVYQRGIGVVQAPTSLVAQVDSAYGGKTGVDLPEAKNYAGVYHQPLGVLADPGALQTLPAAELAAGFAEVLKTALIAGGDLWERVQRVDPTDAAALGELVLDCALTKLEVVGEDERDSGPRAVLNLGHTIAHAVEAVSGYARYRHGEAVALGLLVALRLSGAGELRDRVAVLLEEAGLPTGLDPALETEAIIEATERDKKRTAEGIGFVLCERPGAVSHGHAADRRELIAAVEELRD